jgi:rRNA maturation RNase YbeY
MPQADLSILLVNDRRIRRLNRRYRHIDRATDVLAFPMQEGVGRGIHPWFLGDVVISLERADKQAREKGHPLKQEVWTLLVHGILHLLGYDHEKSTKEASRMTRKEKSILRKVGFKGKVS